jgi:DNA-binding beta-propeller fold protein YncE
MVPGNALKWQVAFCYVKVLLRMIQTTKNWTRSLILIPVLASLLAGCGRLKLNPYSLDTKVVPLHFNIPISFNDFIYDSHLRRVIIPAGETGKVVLINPKNMNVQLISGFSQQVDPANPIVGTTAVAVAGGFLFGLDQGTNTIKTVDLSTNNVVGSIPLKAPAEYIRYISATSELWVTEKDLNQIEIFSVSASADNPPSLQSTGVILVPNGPEGLVIDDARGLAFTNRPNQSLTDVIQVMTHTVIGQWSNGCSSAKGMALDETEGYLFVACDEGKLVVMDINNNGYQITSKNYGGELDFVAYNPKLHHVYLPSSASGIVAIFQLQTLPITHQPIQTNSLGITPTPVFKISLLLLGTADTAIHSKCITADDFNNIWVCDPNHGQVFFIHDTFSDNDPTP